MVAVERGGADAAAVGRDTAVAVQPLPPELVPDGSYATLAVYVAVALGVSFLCSVWEAVLLSVPVSHLQVQADDGHRAAARLLGMRLEVEQPIAAILTLNTIAHTVGAAGAGAEATLIFGSRWFGVISAVLTLAILILSEIVPKTLGHLVPAALGLHRSEPVPAERPAGSWSISMPSAVIGLPSSRTPWGPSVRRPVARQSSTRG